MAHRLGPQSQARVEVGAGLADWLRILKPNIMQLVVFTSAVGLYLAPASPDPLLALVAVVCIAVGAGASGALNNAWDADIDVRMARTRLRPTALGRIAPAEAAAFGLLLALLSVMVMGLALNWLAGLLLAFTIFFYVVIYTIWLKRRTPQNIVIGGLAGALPPLVGWSAATGNIDPLPLVLVAIIFFWTPAHFWALALYCDRDYARAGIPMLPVTAGRRATLQQIALYAVLTAAASLVPLALGAVGWIYALAAGVLGTLFVGQSIALLRSFGERRAMRLFRFSILYLFLLFLALVIDHALPIPLSFGA